MKSRISVSVLLLLSLIALGSIWFFSRSRAETPAQVYPAVVNRDCAPWDGSAFTISIPLEDGSNVAISIYRSPDIRRSTSFSFPDESMREGNALLLLPVGTPEPLRGNAWFRRVEPGMPVEGRFQLWNEAGAQFEGRFVAEWGNEIVYCG